jgi:putative CocE/NonD family hydrolase
MDNYSAVVFPGGVENAAFTGLYVKANQLFDSLATPVDQDKDGALLAQARVERQNASTLSKEVGGIHQFAFRDTRDSDGETVWADNQSLYPLLERINRSGVAVYLIDGWYDIYARDDFLIYNNLTVPKRLMVRLRDHSEIEAAGGDIDYGAEAQRWFDYWLKGIDNGIMEEAPIHYYLQGVDKTSAWQATDTWPLKEQTTTRYYLGTFVKDSTVSTHHGCLLLNLPAADQAPDTYTVDYSTTTGKTPHWTGLATPHKYPNMRSHDEKALTYTLSVGKEGMQVTGHPVVHLWLTTSAPDLDVFVYLEEVDQRGNSTYISQGNLRASHRLLSPAPFENFDLPWHNHFQSELQPIPAGEPFELVFDLLPTAWHFAPGKSLRISVAFADAGNFGTPVLNPAPTLQILRDANHPSSVDIPIVSISR